MEDSKIIDLYWQRNETAIVETDNKYGTYCHTISFNILHIHEDAEECVNDTYQHAWESIPPEHPSKFKTWLGIVVRNLTIDLWRKNHTRKRYDGVTVLLSELDDCVPSNECIEQIEDTKALGACVDDWLSKLSVEDRNIFMRRYWYAESVNAIAANKGLSANALAQRLYRMRNSLKKHLEREEMVL